MKKLFALSALAATSLVGLDASATDILARVISSTPQVQQVAVPRQVCNNQQVITESPKSGGGALLGAIAGGAAGNAIGNGGGRALATMIGVFGGAIVGDRIEGPGAQQVQNVQQCSTQTFYENRTSQFNVVYEYQGQQYTTQMASDPGQFVRLQVTPVGALNAAPQPGFQQPSFQGTQPQTYLQPAPAQPNYIQPQPQAYAQPEVSTIVYQQAPQVIYAQPYYQRPYYAPIGLSLNLGYSRGFGYGHGHGNWR